MVDAGKLLHFELVEFSPEFLNLLAEHVVVLLEILLAILKFLYVRLRPSEFQLALRQPTLQLAYVTVLLLCWVILIVVNFATQLF